MRIYNDLPQHNADGTANPEWLSLRAGKLTGSDFYQYLGIVKKGELSDTAESNLCKKALESTGYLFETIRSDAMERGNELEPEAREAYIMETFNDVQEVAFVDWEKMRAGCSPDGVIYESQRPIDYEEFREIALSGKGLFSREYSPIKKIIEIKCPEIKNYLKMAKGKIPPLYMCQMQYNMLITGAKSCDFVVYHPDMRLIVQEIHADAEYQKNILTALEMLNARYDEILAEIEELKIKGK